MAESAVELIRRGNELANAGDWDAAMALLDPEVEWVIAREHPEARVVRGREQATAYRRSWEQTMSGLRIELDDVREVGGRVLAVGTVLGTGAESAAQIRVPLALLFTLRDGLIVRAEEYLDVAEAKRIAGVTA
jgi:ketosteroid isomerase-like protein